MSVEYYLYCKTHNVVCGITNNKGNPPNREEWSKFELIHAVNVGEGCEIEFLDDGMRDNLWQDRSAFMAEYEPIYDYDGTGRVTRVDTRHYGVYEQDDKGRWARIKGT